MTEKKARIQFQIKLTPENYNKIKVESQKIGLNMSAFVSLLITNYDYTEVVNKNTVIETL